MQRHHRPAALAGRFYVVVGREAAHHAQGDGLLGKHALYGLPVGTPAEPDVADGGDLVGVERRVLGLEVHDQPPKRGRQPFPPPGGLRAEEALHALRLEARSPALQSALGGGARLLGALGRGAAEEHHRADELVVALLGPAAQKLELAPLVRRLGAPAAVGCHLRLSPLAAAPRLARCGPGPPAGGRRMPQPRPGRQPKSRYASRTLALPIFR